MLLISLGPALDIALANLIIASGAAAQAAIGMGLNPFAILVAVALSVAGYQIALTTRTLLAASSASGVMGIIAGAHGPPIALLYQRESPSRIRSVLLPFFAFSNPIALGALFIIGKFGL